ncbi:PA-phosphatase related-family protein [Gracilariopsis chorda]|uniref:PA-phosphatase related-family protein n=1 Tax=Gracilariopsis chorda TaxID=448386 RepID=A0A2V3J6U4_9FLOR|nr:PA-phosphatase related-family protein [Gracilariopsis chorda]|eukprot:PXF50119.1 PA-phosphatase related-family protein [Gracilariopsis chorda]
MAKTNDRTTQQQQPSPSLKWDILTLLAVLLLLLCADLFVPPHVRPVDLKDPAYNYPHIPDIVPTPTVILVAFFAPIVILFVTQLSRLRQVKYLCALYVLALFESNVITILLTSVFKSVAGRPRPYFSSVCESYAENVENLCTGHPSAVREARKSFPSGHSSLVFSAATFTFLYLVHGLRLGEASTSAGLAKMIVALLPLVGAGLIAVSRTIDYHHHFSDIVAGTALGAFIASFVFWCRRTSITKAMEFEQGDGNEYIAVTSDEGSV